MKKLMLMAATWLLVAMSAMAQGVVAKWEMSDQDNLGASTISGEGASMVTTSYLNGTAVGSFSPMTGSNAAEGYTAATYTPCFMQFYPSTRVSGKTVGHCISFGMTPSAGHSFKPTRLLLDAAKCGTDGGNFDIYIKPSGGAEVALATAISPLRNRVDAANALGYSHHEYAISDQLVRDKAFIVIIYFYNLNGMDNANPKAMAFRNVQLEGVIDEPIFTAEHYLQSFTCKDAEGNAINLLNTINGLENGGSTTYAPKLSADPTDLQVVPATGFQATVKYASKEALVTVTKDGVKVFSFKVRFVISNRPVKPEAKPLRRGLISVNLTTSGSSGNLISWRYREADANRVKFKLFKGTETNQNVALNSGKFIYNKTNFLDRTGLASSYYRLEVYDLDDNLIETDYSGKTWPNQSLTIPLGDAPTDPDHGATYFPNDASFCDMDGDGEYEIILKWSPSNEKDAASTGTTSSPYFDCVKLDGTRLWRIRLGDNFFTSAHTIQFIAWDFDGDGYGEFMCKTGPGTVDGQGNYVLLGNDNPNENLLSGRGKQDHGSEYITVFDGTTGAEISTIPYHTNYNAGLNYWGDSNQNRSERYLAALAYLDGYDKNPCPIFARGYYSGAFVAAYDFDGTDLRERWVSRNTTSGQGLWGEGAHWISVGDCDGDGFQEIIYGSAALDHNGKLLYRTGLGHGDALHLGDFVTDHPGLEVFMPHEHKPYGVDLRAATTGTILQRQTESGDTGRGLAAHFDWSQPSAQFLSSARAEMFNCADGSVNAPTWAIGSSGAGVNCRIYWDGDVYDEFFDKSVLGHWNPTYKSFDRIKFNGGNYTWGNLNNGSKNNPCVLGDLLGDWREEIVTWTGDAATGYSLYVNTTNYETNYRLPHLMDDPQYRVQVVNQNVCYNQPPHLSYDPAHELTLTVTIPETGYMPIYTSYSLQIPSGVGVRFVSNFDAKADSLKTTVVRGTIPANFGVIISGKPGQTVTLRPAGAEVLGETTNKLLGDAFLPQLVECTATISYYRWENRPNIGLGFFKINTPTEIPAGEPYLKVTGSTYRDKEYFLVSGTATGIDGVEANAQGNDAPAYTLDGKQLPQTPTHGLFIQGGQKVLK